MDNQASTYQNQFSKDFAAWLDSESIPFRTETNTFDSFRIIGTKKIWVICISLRELTSEEDTELQKQLELRPSPILLWEDVWRRQASIVKSRILAKIGRSVRIPARITRLVRLDKPTADSFLTAHHLNGGTAARYRYGLVLPARYYNRIPESVEFDREAESLLMAVATFAAPRTFEQEGSPYRSGEMVRYASFKNCTVTGGISKLVSHFAEKHRTHDVMTYVDREWSSGEAFEKAGFSLTEQKPVTEYLVDKISFERYPVHRLDNKIKYSLADRLVHVRNAGSLKFTRNFQVEYETKSGVTPPTVTAQPPYDLIFVVGPTASGKTALAVRLAYETGAEIISVDSRQVFRKMDVGTGKDLKDYVIGGKSIPYHLIDIVDPGTPYNVHRYTQDFLQVYTTLLKKKKKIIACGGSGLYVEAVLNILPSVFTNRPPSILIIGINPPPEVRRARIIRRLQDRLNEGLIDEVKSLIEGGLPESLMIHYGLEYKWVTLYLQKKISEEEMKNSLTNEIVRYAKRQVTFFKKIERKGYTIHWLYS